MHTRYSHLKRLKNEIRLPQQYSSHNTKCGQVHVTKQKHTKPIIKCTNTLKHNQFFSGATAVALKKDFDSQLLLFKCDRVLEKSTSGKIL